jgi:DNA-directed RNA polymerase
MSGGIDAESSLNCSLMTQCSSSAGVEGTQRQREQRELERSHWAAINATSRLKTLGRESATAHGQALFTQHAERVTVALGLLLEELLANPNKAGRHLACWPLLLLVNRGPRSMALIALSVVIDTISKRPLDTTLAVAIGRALEDEIKASRIEANRGQALLRLIRRRLGARRLSDPKVLAQLRLDTSGWEPSQRRMVGLLLLEVIEANTDLIQFRNVTSRRRSQRLVEATEAAMAVIAANPPRPSPARKLPLLLPPRDWPGMVGGGHLSSSEPLVHGRGGQDFSYITPAGLAPVLRVVNHLQRQQLLVDPWMVEQQRLAWDHNICGVFPVRREGRPEPPRPTEMVGAEAWGDYQRERRAALREQLEGASERRRIESSIRQCEEVAGLPVWFAYFADFRGRIFSSNRYATHQGPDWEKGAIQFAAGDRVSVEGFEWLLKAAAGHWGISSSWADRLRWGQQHMPELVAAAEAPLDRLGLWRDAKQPWQFLQLCRAIAQQVADPDSLCAVPIRFDQTCSGIGISAALLRDRPLARLTNIWGQTRQDIYGHVAERLIHLLRMDLSNGMEAEQRLAEFWLGFGINRSVTKGPVMTSVYGAQHMGITEGLIALLTERDTDLRVGQWQRGYVTPASYLSRKLTLLLQAELGSCIALRSWLKDTCREVVSRGRPLRWTSPMGFPVQLGQQLDGRRNVTSLTRGQRRWQAAGEEAMAKELSARQTNTSISSNFIHSFDAALCHSIVSMCAEQGVAVLVNHDCFATTPGRAGWLHQALHDTLRALYAPDWMAEVAAEIAGNNRDLKIKAPPMVGSLCPGEIGHNPNCFS